jgi:hypothetical protein
MSGFQITHSRHKQVHPTELCQLWYNYVIHGLVQALIGIRKPQMEAAGAWLLCRPGGIYADVTLSAAIAVVTALFPQSFGNSR